MSTTPTPVENCPFCSQGVYFESDGTYTTRCRHWNGQEFTLWLSEKGAELLAQKTVEAEDRAEASVRGTPDFAFAERVKLARLTAASAVLQSKLGKEKR